MCVVSVVLDDFSRRHGILPWSPSVPYPMTPGPSREEFEALRREVLELRKLLAAAKEFDRATSQPDCETEGKVELVRKIAEYVGVDLSDLVKTSPIVVKKPIWDPNKPSDGEEETE